MTTKRIPRFLVTSGSGTDCRPCPRQAMTRGPQSTSYTLGRLCRCRLENTRHGDHLAHASFSDREEGNLRMADQQYSPRDGAAFDAVLIGGGTGGYVAAIRAAQLGLDA